MAALPRRAAGRSKFRTFLSQWNVYAGAPQGVRRVTAAPGNWSRADAGNFT